MSAVREEFGALVRLAVPIVLANVGTMAMGMVDTIMVGHLDDPRALAGMLVANAWIHGTVMFAMGIVFGIDPIVTQAHGARDGERLGLALQRGVVLALIVQLFIALFGLVL